MREIDRKIIGIIPARNESEFLEKTLDGLKNQTLPLTRVVLVNDGSTDKTAEIAKKFDVEILNLKNRGFRATGEPVLAEVINKGLKTICENECQYIMILGADHVLSSNYVLTIIQEMEKNDFVIASGIIDKESQRDTSPRGSGRIVRYDFWKKYGLEYPCWYGFESYILYKALIENYRIGVVRNANSWSQRKTGKTTNYKNYGKAMRALGYHPLYAMGRILRTLFNNPKRSVEMFFGFLDFSIKKYDIASDVHAFQLIQLKQKLFPKIKSA